MRMTNSCMKRTTRMFWFARPSRGKITNELIITEASICINWSRARSRMICWKKSRKSASRLSRTQFLVTFMKNKINSSCCSRIWSTLPLAIAKRRDRSNASKIDWMQWSQSYKGLIRWSSISTSTATECKPSQSTRSSANPSSKAVPLWSSNNNSSADSTLIVYLLSLRLKSRINFLYKLVFLCSSGDASPNLVIDVNGILKIHAGVKLTCVEVHLLYLVLDFTVGVGVFDFINQP